MAEVEAVAGANLDHTPRDPREQLSATVGLLGLLGSPAEAVIYAREQGMPDHHSRPPPRRGLNLSPHGGSHRWLPERRHLVRVVVRRASRLACGQLALNPL